MTDITQTPADPVEPKAVTPPEPSTLTPASSGNVDPEIKTPVPSERSYTEDGRDLKRESAKMDKLQKELNKARKKSEDLQTSITKIDSWASRKPADYYEALIEVNGWTPEQAITRVKQLHPDWSPKNQAQDTSQKPVLDPESVSALERVKEKQRQEDSVTQETISAFEEKNPDLDEVDKNAIAVNAKRLMDKKGLSMSDALDQAGILVLTPEKYKEEGMVEGMARARSGKSASSGGGSGSALSEQGNQSTDLDLEMKKKFNMTDDQYKTYQKYQEED